MVEGPCEEKQERRGAEHAEGSGSRLLAGSHEAKNQKPFSGFLVSCWSLSLLNLGVLRASAFPLFRWGF